MNRKTVRCIFHIDMDAFFASIEIAQNPSLKGKPIIVGGHPNTRGVVSTCSYEARAFGVHSAMSLSEAYRLCPHGIFLESRYSLYQEYSAKIFTILHHYTAFVEVVSIDEAYLDVSSTVFEGILAKILAATIKKHILAETQLTCTIGIASNKLVAKIAASKTKPDGLLEISLGAESSFLAPLSIQSLPGIGKKTQALLNREGFVTIADLQQLPLEEFVRHHGAWGYHYYHAARGEDNRPVQWEDTLPKSIGAETTFERDQMELSTLIQELNELVDKAHRRLRSHKMRTKRIAIKLRYSDFKTITRSQTLATHINDLPTLQRAVIELFRIHYTGYPLLRLIGVSFEQLTDAYWQPTFWKL